MRQAVPGTRLWVPDSQFCDLEQTAGSLGAAAFPAGNTAAAIDPARLAALVAERDRLLRTAHATAGRGHATQL